MAKKSKKIPPAPRVQSLEEARANSKHSSSPPSADGSEVKRGDNAQGAQNGHKGHKRPQVPENEVDEVFKFFPQSHCCCGGKVVPGDKPYHRHQIFERPEPQYNVVEYLLYLDHCEHGSQTYKASVPDTVSETQMGPNLITYIALQSGQFHQSIQKTQLQLQQNDGLYLSTGAISIRSCIEKTPYPLMPL